MTPLVNATLHLLAVVAKAEMCSLVEEHTDALVRELVAKAVFVGVVHPLCHPQEGLGLGQRGRVSGGWRRKHNCHSWRRKQGKKLNTKTKIKKQI